MGRKKNTLRTTNKLKVRPLLIYGGAFMSLAGVVFAILFSYNIIGSSSDSKAYSSSLADYVWTKNIEIDHNRVSGNGDLIDFPILFSITDPDLKSVLNAGYVTSENGYDIAFADDVEPLG